MDWFRSQHSQFVCVICVFCDVGHLAVMGTETANVVVRILNTVGEDGVMLLHGCSCWLVASDW